MIDKSFLTVRDNPKYKNNANSSTSASNYTPTNVKTSGGINLDDLFNNNKNKKHVANNSKFSYSNNVKSNEPVLQDDPLGLNDTDNNIFDLSNSVINEVEKNNFDNSLLPKFNDAPMFGLNPLCSGIGNINININSTKFSKIVVALELNDGSQFFVPDNSLYKNGVLLNKDGSVSVDLSKCWDIKRILLSCTTNSTGVLMFDSPEFGWSKQYQLLAGNGNYAELGFLYFFDNRIVIRKSFAHYYTLRDVAVANGFSNIMWLDDNSPQIL